MEKYGGHYVQYTKENISAQTRVKIHKQNIQYTIRSIGSRKYVSVHDKFGKYTTTYREQENSIRKYILFSIHNKMLHLRTLGIM